LRDRICGRGQRIGRRRQSASSCFEHGRRTFGDGSGGLADWLDRFGDWFDDRLGGIRDRGRCVRHGLYDPADRLGDSGDQRRGCVRDRRECVSDGVRFAITIRLFVGLCGRRFARRIRFLLLRCRFQDTLGGILEWCCDGRCAGWVSWRRLVTEW
jgi:hypothetical protein